jgi:ATP-dependent protease Clp ATPase subunit
MRGKKWVTKYTKSIKGRRNRKMNKMYFGCDIWICEDMSVEIEKLIDKNYKKFSQETIKKLRYVAEYLLDARDMMIVVDDFISGNDSAEKFHQRWEKEVGK